VSQRAKSAKMGLKNKRNTLGLTLLQTTKWVQTKNG
jgi:hypothetical protein